MFSPGISRLISRSQYRRSSRRLCRTLEAGSSSAPTLRGLRCKHKGRASERVKTAAAWCRVGFAGQHELSIEQQILLQNNKMERRSEGSTDSGSGYIVEAEAGGAAAAGEQGEQEE